MGDPVMDNIREKHRAKQAAQKEKYEEHKAAIESGEKKLVVEHTPSGLHYVKFEGGGQLPEVLKGMFTSVEKIRQLCVAKYGKDLLRT